MSAQLTFAFVAGAVATANPCGFGLLLAYLARQLGMDGRGAAGGVGRALTVGALTTGGFLVVFAAVGAAISATGSWLIAAVPWAGLAVGIALMVVGAVALSGRHVGSARLARLAPAGGSRSALGFGMAYGVCSIACTLPIFLVVAGLSLAGGPLAKGLTFVAYAGGMGTVLTALAVAIALARGGLASVVRRLLPHFARISGALLLLAGAYVVYYWVAALAELPSGTTLSWPLDAISGLSSALETRLASGSASLVLSWLLIVLVALAAGLGVYALLGRWTRSPAASDRELTASRE